VRGPLAFPLFLYHLGRTVHWGNWGIDFCDQQPDERKNFGVVSGTLLFGVGARGPVDGTFGSERREELQSICDAWTNEGCFPPAPSASLRGRSKHSNLRFEGDVSGG